MSYENNLQQAARDSYRRGQVEWALWRWATTPDRLRDAPPAFLARIKRLLEIDREVGQTGNKEPEDTAFYSELPKGTGSDVGYSAFNAFCLALGLDLLDAGFKQGEVVSLLQAWRGELKVWFEQVLRSPPVHRDKLPLPSQRPNCPTYEKDGQLHADCRIYAVIEKVEMTEVFSGDPNAPAKGKPLIRKPRFCRGIQALAKELDGLPYRHRKAVVIEIAHTIVVVINWLAKAEVKKRGRQAA